VGPTGLVGTAESRRSVPSPVNSLLTRPFPLSTPSINSATTSDGSPRLFKPPVSRRKVLAGLAGVAALGIAGGGISRLAFFQRPERLSSGQIATKTSPTEQGLNSANTPIPTNQFIVPSHEDTPTPVTTPGPAPTTPAQTPTPSSQPSPTPVPKLTVEMVSPPSQVTNNSQVIVNVTANEASVTVLLHATYNVSSNTYDSGMQVTDSQGNAALVWQVQVPKFKHDHVTATVTVSGVDQSGQQAQSSSITVNILPNNQNR